MRHLLCVSMTLAAAACGGRAAPAPVAPVVPANSGGALEPAEVIAADGDPHEADCVAFADDAGPQLCMTQEAGGNDGDAIAYSLYLMVPDPAAGWRIADRQDDEVRARPEMMAVGEFTVAAEVGGAVAIGPGRQAIELHTATSREEPAENGGGGERGDTTIVMGYRDDALIELFRVETWYEGYVDDDGGQEQGYEVQDEAHGGLYDVVITTRTVKNEWPTDRHVDRTAAERLTWNGTAYDRVPIYDGEDEDEGATVDDDDADDGTDGDTDDGDTDDGTDGTDGTDGDAGDADQPWD